MSSEINLAKQPDIQQAVQTFKKNHRVQINSFLEPKSAHRVYNSLHSQIHWNLAWNLDGQHHDMDYIGVQKWSEPQKKKLDDLIHDQAAHDFQYRYASVPIYDIYKQNLLPGHFFNSIYEFINRDEVLSLARQITGFEQIALADIQATRYSKGHFLTEHDDAVKGKHRLAAYVLNLTPKWKSDWGGALIFPNDHEQAEAWFPRFNVLNIFAVPQKHAVTVVSPFAPVNRYSLTGWFRSS